MSLDVIPRSAYTEDHEAFRQTVRQFLQKEIAPHADKWAADESFPRIDLAQGRRIGPAVPDRARGIRRAWPRLWLQRDR